MLSSVSSLKQATKETWLLSLQFKIVHNILATNKRLYDWRIRQSYFCVYCDAEDTIEHYIWECPFSQSIIFDCLKWLRLENEGRNTFNKENFIFGFNDIRLDNLSMIIKSYIYMCKKYEKSHDKTNFMKEIATRFMSDKAYINENIFNIKWQNIYIDVPTHFSLL